MKYFFYFYGMKNPIYVERETEQQQNTKKKWNFENEKQKKKDKNSIPFSVLFCLINRVKLPMSAHLSKLYIYKKQTCTKTIYLQKTTHRRK